MNSLCYYTIGMKSLKKYQEVNVLLLLTIRKKRDKKEV